MDAGKVQEIIDSYLFDDIENEDVKAEIVEKISVLSDDPNVEVVVQTQIDSEHDGLLVEVTEHGEITEYVTSFEFLSDREHEEEDDDN